MRVVSLIVATIASLVGLIFPFILGLQATGLNQSILLVMMCGITGAFIYGAGFSPRQRALAFLISPRLCMPLIICSFATLVAIR